MAPPFLFSGLSVTITMLLFFVFLNPRPMNVSKLVHVRPSSDDGRFSTGSYCAVLCQEARITPHHFDKEDTVMGGCRVPDFIHAFHNGVQCRIISYGKIGTI